MFLEKMSELMDDVKESGKRRAEEDEASRRMLASLMERLKEREEKVEVAWQKAAEEARLEDEATRLKAAEARLEATKTEEEAHQLAVLASLEARLEAEVTHRKAVEDKLEAAEEYFMAVETALVWMGEDKRDRRNKKKCSRKKTGGNKKNDKGKGISLGNKVTRRMGNNNNNNKYEWEDKEEREIFEGPQEEWPEEEHQQWCRGGCDLYFTMENIRIQWLSAGF